MVAVAAIGLGVTTAHGQAYSTFASGFSAVRGLAFDTSGNLYVASNTGVSRVNVTNGAYVSQNNTFVTGVGSATGVAFDTSGNLYISNQATNPGAIYKASSAQLAAGGTSTTAGAGGAASTFVSSTILNRPYGISFDTSGNLWVGDYLTNSVNKIPITGGVPGTPVTFTTVNSDVQGIAFDTTGNFYIGAIDTSTISKYSSTASLITSPFASVSGSIGLAFDVSGNLFATNFGGNTIVKITIVGGANVATTTVATNTGAGAGFISGPVPLAFDTYGNLYVGNFGGTTVTKIILLPTVTALSVATGPAVGGTSVTITGTSFTAATAVTFGGVNATSFTVNSQTSITAIAPAGTAGTADVKVTTAGGTSVAVAADQFTYYGTPSVTSVNPVAGPAGGGTSVTITGTGFTGATSVKFGSVSQPTFTVNSATSITTTSPAGTLGTTVDVTVSNPIATSSTGTADNFTYEATPTVTAVGPTGGGLTAGTSVTITGTGFIGASAVKFGANNASSFVVNSSTSITAIAPAGTAGTVDVKVTTPIGTSGTSAADNYTYYAVPTVTGISPIAGAVTGGGTVTITGTNLSGATAVNFGTLAGTVTANTGTSITVTVPAGVLGTYDVTVTTPGGDQCHLQLRQVHVRRSADRHGAQPGLGSLDRWHHRYDHGHQLHRGLDRQVRHHRGDDLHRQQFDQHQRHGSGRHRRRSRRHRDDAGRGKRGQSTR